MNNFMNSWTSIGKREPLPPFNHHGEPSPEPARGSEERGHHLCTDRRCPRLVESPKKFGMLGGFALVSNRGPALGSGGKGLLREPSLPPIHPRLRLPKEILLEVCLIDRVNAQKYRSLDARQKSLVNVILGVKFQPALLDLLDTGGVNSVDTEKYLKELPKHSSHELIMYLRLRGLLDTEFPTLRLDESFAGGAGVLDHLAKRYFGCMALGLGGLSQADGCVMFREVWNIRHLATLAMNTGKKRDWLAGMKHLLTDLLLVSQEEILSEYEKTIDNKLSTFFYDENFEVSSFFAKLKVKLKDGISMLPMTNFELKRLDSRVTGSLKDEVKLLTAFLQNTHSAEPLKNGNSVLNLVSGNSSLQLFENSIRENLDYSLLKKSRYAKD